MELLWLLVIFFPILRFIWVLYRRSVNRSLERAYQDMTVVAVVPGKPLDPRG
jgi:hypothetical protein